MHKFQEHTTYWSCQATMQVSGGVNSNSPASPQSRRFWSSPLRRSQKNTNSQTVQHALGILDDLLLRQKAIFICIVQGKGVLTSKKELAAGSAQKNSMVQRVKAFLYPLGLLHGPFPARPFLFAVPHDTGLQFQGSPANFAQKGMPRFCNAIDGGKYVMFLTWLGLKQHCLLFVSNRLMANG